MAQELEQGVAVDVVRAGVGYRDQSARGLSYRLYRGGIDPRALSIVAQRSVILGGGLEATLFVLGASHAVEIRWRHQGEVLRLTELLACCETPPEGTLLDCFAVPASLHEDRGYVCGAMELRVQTRILEHNEASLRWLRSRLDDRRLADRALVACFPSSTGEEPELAEVEKAPLTLVLVDPPGPGVGAARLETVHSYPNERRLVVTETHIQLESPTD